VWHLNSRTEVINTHKNIKIVINTMTQHSPRTLFFLIWFERLLPLRHSWPIVPALGHSEDDCGEPDGM
jgi:hypothetical protein